MSMAFEHQLPAINSGFTRATPQQQQVGVRLKPNEKKPKSPKPQRPLEPRNV
jgi:hypothetical protein